jgi:hypothetical protein
MTRKGSRKDSRQTMIAIAGAQIVAGGGSAPSAVYPHPSLRTTTDARCESKRMGARDVQEA